ncbi:MAG: YbaK/EbsC family protein [Clostridia bacterium]|nr:YbaK/EbsC family protein [Clostridia bacterium]
MNEVKDRVYKLFDKLKIEYTVMNHRAIFSENDSDGIEEKCEGTICKNLFLKEKGGTKFYLVSLPLHKRADIKKLEKELNIKKLTFGNEEELFEKLNIRSGSVSILNMIEAPNTDVYFIIDQELLNHDKVCFHPNDNTSSISFKSKELVKILDYFSVKYDFFRI